MPIGMQSRSGSGKSEDGAGCGARARMHAIRIGGIDLVGVLVELEIGIPFVEQINPRIGVVDDFLERFELALAGGRAELLVHRFRHHEQWRRIWIPGSRLRRAPE
jgi:hypothetical protein